MQQKQERSALRREPGTRRSRRVGRGPRLFLALAVGTVGTGCATTAPSTSSAAADNRSPLSVVAAENFWGSIAAQLGGEHVRVASIIDNPDADPHDYQPTAADARRFSDARFVIDNGVGYDPWAAKLIAASPGQDRSELTIGAFLGVPDDGNPHRWYSPPDVERVLDKITAEYKKLDPADAAYFDQQRTQYDQQGLAAYHQTLATIQQRYAGVPIGASESIVTPLAAALGLDLVTPRAFLRAVSEGTDPSAADKTTIDQQIATNAIQVYVYNSQNATPDVRAQVDAARAAGIPLATMTETLTPAGATFQAWQTRQLQQLQQALATGTGR